MLGTNIRPTNHLDRKAHNHKVEEVVTVFFKGPQEVKQIRLGTLQHYIRGHPCNDASRRDYNPAVNVESEIEIEKKTVFSRGAATNTQIQTTWLNRLGPDWRQIISHQSSSSFARQRCLVAVDRRPSSPFAWLFGLRRGLPFHQYLQNHFHGAHGERLDRYLFVAMSSDCCCSCGYPQPGQFRRLLECRPAHSAASCLAVVDSHWDSAACFPESFLHFLACGDDTSRLRWNGRPRNRRQLRLRSTVQERWHRPRSKG